MTVVEQIERLAQEFEDKTAQDILSWAFSEFEDKVALASSFGAEDTTLIDMIVKINPEANIFTLDTGRLPEETYKVWEEIENKYGIKIVPYCPSAIAVEKMVKEHGPNLFYKSLELRKSCCGVRKVEPLNRALSGLDAWITGLRREQSVTRVEVRKVGYDAGMNLVKINPIADWSEDRLWNYIRENKVPYNDLHDRDYPSIGCAPCTRALKTGEDIRAGRWWWESPEKKECGLHK